MDGERLGIQKLYINDSLLAALGNSAVLEDAGLD